MSKRMIEQAYIHPRLILGWAAACSGMLLCAVSVFSQGGDLISNRTIVDNQLTALVGEVLKNNPDIKAARYKTDAAAASAGYRKGLDPPQVNVEFYRSPVSAFPNPFKDQAEYDYSVQQMFPFPGKLSAMAGVEKNRAAMFGSDRAMLELDAVRDLKVYFFNLYSHYRSLQVNAETRDVVKTFVAAAQKQYEVGLGRQADILRAQTELSTLVNDEMVLQQEIRSLEAAINALRNRPVDTPVEAPAEVEPPADSLTFAQLAPLAESSRPELSSAKYGMAMQKSERAAASREFYPDFMVRGMYKQMIDSPDDWSLMLGLTLPVAPWSYGRYASLARQAEASENEAGEQYTARKNMVLAQVQDALVKVQSGRERVGLYRNTIIPQAVQTLQSVMAGYQTGRQDFLSLIDAERMLLGAKRDYHMAVASLLDGRAQLERAVGLSMSEIEHTIQGGR
jgi:outer membrane protein, heavy metal efflux system